MNFMASFSFEGNESNRLSSSYLGMFCFGLKFFLLTNNDACSYYPLVMHGSYFLIQNKSIYKNGEAT